MEDHFNRLLDVGVVKHATSSKGPVFISNSNFTGAKAGYVFKNGDRGIGYYIDGVLTSQPGVLQEQDSKLDVKKRKLHDDG